MKLRNVLIACILGVMIISGVVVYNILNEMKDEVSDIYSLELGSSTTNAIDLLGEPSLIDEDQESVRAKVRNLRDNIISTNKTMNVSANKETIELLTSVLENENATFICYVYRVVEKTPNGPNEYQRSLYFADDKLIFN